MRQPTLFETPTVQTAMDVEQVVLYALGDFQSRGKVLAERDLPLDRLRGALRRASEDLKVEELSDMVAVAMLETLGAGVRKVPSFVAKHPFHIIVSSALADRARRSYAEARAILKAS